jgi:hypothetical protein
MVVNNQVMEVINNKADELVKSGINVDPSIMEQMITQGGGLVLNKNILEPLLKGLPPEKIKEILFNMNFFGEKSAENFMP